MILDNDLDKYIHKLLCMYLFKWKTLSKKVAPQSFFPKSFHPQICKLNFVALAQNTEMDKELWAM